jgi:hypothetical protein
MALVQSLEKTRAVGVCSWDRFKRRAALPDAGVGLLELEEAGAALGEHGRRLGIQGDGFGEEVERFAPETRSRDLGTVKRDI